MATKILALRAEREWSQLRLARRAKVPQADVAHLETSARQNPSLPTLRRIAMALGVPMAELLT
jgi:transcriptional regulator with XRE-family HTH domain